VAYAVASADLGIFQLVRRATRAKCGIFGGSDARRHFARIFAFDFVRMGNGGLGVGWSAVQGNLRTLSGGRWTSWRRLAQDVAIAIPFWGVWELTARVVHHAVERVQTPTTAYHPPAGFAEVFLWILLSVSAGVCEEIIYRGYFQQQFRAARRSVMVAVILQASVFGMVHAYQGWKQVVMIAPLGILYGALVAWRANLRASMIAHLWSDIFEGWLKFV
jgi:membrane protease YdiL (CAAX protease family)